MELRNITNRSIGKHSVVHQIDNEGCKCHLCQKVIIKEIHTIKHCVVEDHQSEMTKGEREEYFSKFLQEFFFIDKMNRKIKLIFPEMCIFQKGAPTCLITKKRETLPMKMIKNKEKLNAFQIQNFFIEGYVFHNNFKQNSQGKQKEPMFKLLKKQIYNFDESLKNQCIVLIKFRNGSCQMLTPIQLSNLFKSKQRNTRAEILNITTMVCSSNYNQIRIHLNLTTLEYSEFLERAKNQVKMINEDIKPKDFLFIPQRDERAYQEKLKEENPKKYLQYLSLKLLLFYSLRTDILFQQSLFKFVKDQAECYYLVDIQVYKKSESSKVWGYFTEEKKNLSPTKTNRKRPASSPQRMQRKVDNQEDLVYADQGALIMPKGNVLRKESSGHGRVKTSGILKLEPILMKKKL